MADKDFVNEMRDNLKQQQNSNELTARNTLHNADVISREGKKNWKLLLDWFNQAIPEIDNGLEVHGDKDYSFVISNSVKPSGVSVSFEPGTGNIEYQGTAAGIFRAQVLGNGLRYVLQQTSPSKQATSTVNHTGGNYELERIGEFLIRIAVNG